MTTQQMRDILDRSQIDFVDLKKVIAEVKRRPGGPLLLDHPSFSFAETAVQFFLDNMQLFKDQLPE